MKIAFVNQPNTPAAPPRGCDSIGIWSYEIARRLAGSNHVLFYGRGSGKETAVQREAGVEYRGVAAPADRALRGLRLLDRWRLAPARRPIFASRWFHHGYGLRVARDLRRQAAEIIHVHNYSQFVPVLRAHNPQAKIVVHMHCEWLSQLDPRWIAPRLAQADLVLGCSDYITAKIRDRFPDSRTPCGTAYCGVDTQHFTRSLDEEPNLDGRRVQRILYVGRLSPEKGVHVLLDAFAQLAARRENLQLDLIGPEAVASPEFIVRLSDEPHVRRLAALYSQSYLTQLKNRIAPQWADRVVFHGNQPQTALRKFYQATDVVVTPSLSESFGMSLIEAMAAEKPVVATRVGGMTHVLADGETGLLVAPDDPAALAGALDALLADEPTRARMGRAGRARVLERFCWDRVSEQLQAHYARLGGRQ